MTLITATSIILSDSTELFRKVLNVSKSVSPSVAQYVHGDSMKITGDMKNLIVEKFQILFFWCICEVGWTLRQPSA